ncbi:hypothetical protein COOONC_11109 [Cooperia oncophora]
MSVDGRTILEKIWNPHACFVNSKLANIHSSPFKNIFLQIYSNGSIWYNYRIKLTGPCSNTLRLVDRTVSWYHACEDVSLEQTYNRFNSSEQTCSWVLKGG